MNSSSASPSDRQVRELARQVGRSLVDAAGPGNGRPLIAALSGGADSSAMVLLLADTQARHGWRVHAAHVDHQIQADTVRAVFRDAATTLAEMTAMPINLLDADARAEARASNDGLEAAARRVRYRALTQLALERGAQLVAVAHTQEDQAETVLLHIIRGSGLDGLSGMPPIRPLHDEVRLVRPMLGLTRSDSELVCSAYDWTPAHDPSNDLPEFTRNRIRQELLPLMRGFNPNIAEGLARMAHSLRGDRELLDLIGRETLAQVRDAEGVVQRRALLALPGQLQTRVIRAFCQEAGITLSAERTAAALQIILHGHGVVELPDGARLSVARGTIELLEGCPPNTGGG